VFAGDYTKLVKTAFDARARMFTIGADLVAAMTKLTGATRALTDEAVQHGADEFERSLLLTRIATLRFMVTNDPKELATFRANTDQTGAALSTLEEHLPADVKPLVAPVRTAFSAYVADFAPYSDAKLKESELFMKQARAGGRRHHRRGGDQAPGRGQSVPPPGARGHRRAPAI